MTEELLHDAVLIWLLRRLDLSKARREVFEYFQMLTEQDDGKKISGMISLLRSLIFLIDMNCTTVTVISALHALMNLSHFEPR